VVKILRLMAIYFKEISTEKFISTGANLNEILSLSGLENAVHGMNIHQNINPW